MIRLTVFLCCVCISLLLPIGCGFTGDADSFGDDTLLMNNLAEPSQLDPAMQTSVEDQRLTLALFEGLTSYHPKTLQPIEGIAHSWEISEDRRRYTFHLRPSHWREGSSLNAAEC